VACCVVLFSVSGGSLETGLEFVVEPEDIVVARGTSLVWNCSAVSSPGLPPPTITWLKDGRLIGDGRLSVLPSGALSIRRIVQRPRTQGDESIYECLATNSIGTITSRPVLLRIACVLIVELLTDITVTSLLLKSETDNIYFVFSVI